MSEMGPMSVRSRRRWRINSCPALNGIEASSAQPIATDEPSGTKRAIASRMDMTFALTSLLATLVLRLPFLHEGLEAFLRVLAREQPRDGFVLVREPAGEWHTVAEHRRELDPTDRERRPSRVRPHALHGLGLELRGKDDLIDDAERQRLRRRDRGAAQHEVERLLLADEARQPLRAAGPRQQSERHLWEADAVLTVGRDPEVAAQRDLETAAQAMPVDRRDNDLRRSLELAHDLVGLQHEEVLLFGVALGEPRDVGTRGEELLGGAAQQDRLALRVPARGVDRGIELVEESLVVGVRRRAIERDDTHRVLPRVRNSHRAPAHPRISDAAEGEYGEDDHRRRAGRREIRQDHRGEGSGHWRGR